MAPLHVGDLEAARRAIRENLGALVDLTSQGWDVVCCDATSAAVFRLDAPWLVRSHDAKRVAERTFEFSEYLARLDRAGALPPPDQPLHLGSIAYHEPCHQKALESAWNPATTLQRIDGSQLLMEEAGCSGMAGVHGLSAKGYEFSLKAGARLIERFRRPDVNLAVTQCGACAMQIEHATGKQAYHPAQLFAWAYNLAPPPKALSKREPKS
jgi:Fe-S oxidoreductase